MIWVSRTAAVRSLRSAPRDLAMNLDEQLLDTIRSGDDPVAVKDLLERGARTDVPAEHGWTALAMAIQDERVETVRALLDHGVSPSYTDQNSDSALLLACFRENLPIARLLVERGAPPNTRGSEGDIPLKHAASVGNVDLCRLLLDAGADPNAEGGIDGLSVLSAAVVEGHVDVVRLLIERGVKLNEFDLGNDTPLTRAMREEQQSPSDERRDIVTILRQAGALTNAEIVRRTS
jgi:ankyrin repeat protein